MSSATQAWLEGLRSFTDGRRSGASPAVMRSVDDPGSAQEAERAVLAAWLEGWLESCSTMLAARREWIAAEAGAGGADPDPAIVLTTSAVGVDAALALFGRGDAVAGRLAMKIAAVTEVDYRLWCIRHPDPGHRWHVNVWNWVKTRVPARRHAEFVRHPLGEGEAYWLHRAGLTGAGAADRRECHLWKWTGRGATLLEAFVAERGVTGLR